MAFTSGLRPGISGQADRVGPYGVAAGHQQRVGPRNRAPVLSLHLSRRLRAPDRRPARTVTQRPDFAACRVRTHQAPVPGQCSWHSTLSAADEDGPAVPVGR